MPPSPYTAECEGDNKEWVCLWGPSAGEAQSVLGNNQRDQPWNNLAAKPTCCLPSHLTLFYLRFDSNVSQQAAKYIFCNGTSIYSS